MSATSKAPVSISIATIFPSLPASTWARTFSSLTPDEVVALAELEGDILADFTQLWLAYVHCYDQRGGGVETSFKQDNQALGIRKRNKKCFEAQQMLTQLNASAHNVLKNEKALYASNSKFQTTDTQKP